jgi:hypothetical protein
LSTVRFTMTKAIKKAKQGIAENQYHYFQKDDCFLFLARLLNLLIIIFVNIPSF